MVEGLEEEPPRQQRVLDVGSGAGVLAFVALALGARLVVGFDTDLEAGFIARENSRLNQFSPLLFVGRASALRATTSFDLILINVLPERIAADLPRLGAMLAAGGRMLISGLLTAERDRHQRRWRELGLAAERIVERDEWSAVRLRAAR